MYSDTIKKYFESLQAGVNSCHDLARKARLEKMDPSEQVEIQLAKNMAERVVGLISVVAPQLVGSGVVERIIELEEKYGSLDWRVALQIALEIAEQKFCKFEEKKDAIEIGIRTGFAYSTVGVVSSPLDGLINIEFRPRLDGKGEYMALNFAGPIRNAGGTNAAVSVLIGDYVRKKMGYAEWDVQEGEINRAKTELSDYHDRITNLQYVPSEPEIEFLLKKMPVEIGGEPSEKIEVSNYKDQPRISTNLIRSGYCLIYSSCIPLKAPKLWKQLSSWGKDFDMEHWNFLEEFLKIQKEQKSKGATTVEKKTEGISPDFTFIKDLVAGRPIFTHPLKEGGFRLRYGRTRNSGYSAYVIHPATMYILNEYLATGTQLKLERPGKATSLGASDTIDGPIVLLNNGSVVYVDSMAQAKEIRSQVKRVLFLGDILINYGDFFNRAHSLVPPGYCEEWYALELEKAIVDQIGGLDFAKAADLCNVSQQLIEKLVNSPFESTPTAEDCLRISKSFGVPLHPAYTYHWKTIQYESLEPFFQWLKKMNVFMGEGVEKIVLPIETPKEVLENIGVPHLVSNNEFVIIEGEHAKAFYNSLFFEGQGPEQVLEKLAVHEPKEPLSFIQKTSPYKIRDKSGVFIGARMGRPEKAKMRKMTGSPHSLFPIGEEGGRLRCFQSALEEGKVNAKYPTRFCDSCGIETIYPACHQCGKKSIKKFWCNQCEKYYPDPKCEKHQIRLKGGKYQEIKIQEYFNNAIKLLQMGRHPDLIKGVRETFNTEFIEHLAKGILRAKHEVYVFKDGTIRYDMTQLPITHFKAKEIGTSVEELRELGYLKDIYRKELINDNQVIELFPQDVILPACRESPNEGCDIVLFKVTNFIDELLVKLYKKTPFYNLKKPQEIVGHLAIALAPHTSAGTVCRIIGFSKTQGFLAHPLVHAATRRDCDGDEACVLLLMDAFLNFSKEFLPQSRGGTMDAPLVLTSLLNPKEVDDMVFDMDIAWNYSLEFYEAASAFKAPWDVKIDQLKPHLGTPKQYEEMGFTHPLNDINETVKCSAYKTLPSMQEKLSGQMDIAEKVRAVYTEDVARLVIEKHFIRDTKGNLRKFSMQQFRCVKCNSKFRRAPLIGKCKCGGKIIFTISEGSVIKYLEPTINLSKKYHLSAYLDQSIELLRRRVESVFGKEKEKQEALGKWFG